MDAFWPDYPYFDAYEAGVLQEKSTLEQLLTMDSELANYIHLSKYIGPLYPADLPILRFLISETQPPSTSPINTECDAHR